MSDVEYRYELRDGDGMMVASVDAKGDNDHRAIAEIRHYALVYSQDCAVHIYMVKSEFMESYDRTQWGVR